MSTSLTRGFTLIETIIYLALFSILMGGAVVTAYNLFESSSRAHTIAMIQEEGDFLLGKVDWMLYGAEAITAPSAGTTCTTNCTLSVVKWDTSIGNPLQLCLAGTDMRFSTSSATCVTGPILNNADVSVTTLTIMHATSSGDGINPEFASTTFTLQARTPAGALITRSFSSVSYLRQ